MMGASLTTSMTTSTHSRQRSGTVYDTSATWVRTGFTTTLRLLRSRQGPKQLIAWECILLLVTESLDALYCLDYARWAEKHCKQEFKPLSRQEVTVEELEMVAAEQKVKFMPGDILLIRMGWMAAHLKTPEVMAGAKIPQCIGLKACQKTFKWLWDHQFAAVASDVIALEAFPPHNWDDSLRK